jgi:outer membrane protein assembly factor BamB
MMKKKFLPLLILAALSMLLSACSSSLAANGFPQSSADQGNVYVAYGQRVYAVRASDGAMVWRFPSDKAGTGFFGAPQLTKDGQLIFGGFDKILYSVNPQTGVQNWTFTGSTDRYEGSPLVTDQAIYAPSTDHKLYAVDLKGAKLWEFKTNNMLWSRPATDGKLIYLPSMDHFLYALDLSGQKVWASDLGGALLGTPLIGPDNVLYVGSLNNELLAVDATNGSILWRFATSGGVWGMPAIQGNNLYFGDMKGTFYVVDKTTHQPVTSFQPDGPIVATPLVETNPERVVFGTENGSLIAVDYSGKQIWNTNPPINGKLYSTPIQVGDRIAVAITGAEQLLVFVDQDGKQIGTPFVPPK